MVSFVCQSLMSWLAIQVCLIIVFLWCLSYRQKKLLPDDQLPKTAVILCLRGANQTLTKCLRSLLNQNYPRYDLKIIIDHQADPTWKIATDTISKLGATNVEISPLKIIRTNCSLKCSSLVQAVSELDDSYKVVALVDADIITPPHWLRELVSPLANSKVGATTGNCWYVPTGNSWGSLVRYIGNVSTVVQMYLFGIPWGGSLAIKTDVLCQTGLLDKWGQALCEDFMIPRVLGQYKMQVKFVPSLMMLNQEECDLPSFRNSIERLLLCSRLYHPRWSAVVGDVISSILFPTLACILFLGALFSGDWEATGLLFSCYSAYTLGLLWLMLILESGVQQVIRYHGQPLTQLSSATILKMLIGIPLTQWIYALGFLSSLRMSIVHWGGVTYRVTDPWNIRLVESQLDQLFHQPGDGKLS